MRDINEGFIKAQDYKQKLQVELDIAHADFKKACAEYGRSTFESEGAERRYDRVFWEWYGAFKVLDLVDSTGQRFALNARQNNATAKARGES